MGSVAPRFPPTLSWSKTLPMVPTAPPSDDDGGHYQQYKQATAAFFNGLHSLLPVPFPLEKVDDLGRSSSDDDGYHYQLLI